MRQLIIDKVASKRIVILGFGMEGQSSLRYLLEIGIQNKLVVADQNPQILAHDLIQKHQIEVLSGDEYLNALQEEDFIIKSPGVQLRKYRPELFSHSQTSLFLEKFGYQIIGITGTKGKSTTSTMMFKILEEQNKKAFLVGNIGQPAFDLIPQIDEETWIVYELSAHQLQCVKQGPRMAILLNLMPEHLDYFTSIEEYYQAKLHIFLRQGKSSFAFMHEKTIAKVKKLNHPDIHLKSKLLDGKLIIDDEIIIQNTDLKYLLGQHHIENIQALIELILFLGLDLNQACHSIKNFHPLPHRQEFLGEKRGIRFINDSISTIPQSAIQAVKAITDVDYLILGGLDRGIDYSELVSFLSQAKFHSVYFLGAAGKRILKELNELNISIQFRAIEKEKLQDIKDELFQINSGTVLLSPAAASYDHFKNFEARGNYFREIFSKI